MKLLKAIAACQEINLDNTDFVEEQKEDIMKFGDFFSP